MRYALIIWFVVAFPVSCDTVKSSSNDSQTIKLDSTASINNVCRTYDPVWVSPYKTLELSDLIRETSGLILWDSYLWTHNDNSDTKLYALDTSSAELRMEYFVPGVENKDWEEISQDEEFIYVGDFGNNGSGSRKDLHILRFGKASLKAGHPSIDTIWFSYSDQQDLSPTEPNQTEFDCEAFVVSSDSIYLFTKQWISAHTSIYAMSKEPGKYIAEKRSSFNIEGLVTGAALLEKEHLLVLCGYSSLTQPFLYLLFDYTGNDFFSGNKWRVNISLLFHQIEGVATEDGLKYYLSNEYSNLSPAGYVNPQKIHVLDLGPYLRDYIEGDVLTSGI